MKLSKKRKLFVITLALFLLLGAAAPLATAQTSNYTPLPDAVWFGDIEHIIPRGTDMRIQDVVTGRSFNIRRTFGNNHADIEPLTTEDSATIYDIWGGWSWGQRAVLVYVNGYVIPASLNAMPHAGRDDFPPLVIVDNRSGGFGRGQNLNMINGNGMDGHLCLHFRESRSHGTNQVVAAHQNRVNEAAEHIRQHYGQNNGANSNIYHCPVGVTVEINGLALSFPDQGPIVRESRTLVPVRGVFEQLNFVVIWEPATQGIILIGPNHIVNLTLGSDTFYTNGVPHLLDVPAQAVSDRTMLPIRAVLESVGYHVGWDSDRAVVLVNG